MASQPGKQTVVIHILPNISMTKGNQTMKSYIECVEETILRYFSKKPKLNVSLDLKSKVYAVCFYCMPS